MTAARVTGTSEGTAHPPIPRPPNMHEWLAEKQRLRDAPLWRRIFRK